MIYHALIAGDNTNSESFAIQRAALMSKRTQEAYRRSIIALIQVCSQIRTEFRPLYLQSRKVKLEVRLLSGWISALYPSEADSMCTPAGITVELPQFPDLGGWDLLPLLRMRHLSEDEIIVHRLWFDRPDASHDTYYNNGGLLGSAMFDCFTLQDFVLFNSEGWKGEILGGKFATVRLRDWSSDMYIHVVFKPEHAPKYINKEYADEEQVLQYMNEVGLASDIIRLRVGVEQAG
ncbi:hypothetical protein K504DRAFT_523451 [Pleomassaria siparia CBS 279.74]|uniref:Uncharacterized protein n=1 Tax=Pleomassaria siparia CBS 279.74 TaxID=1314801 RepID=A0A6G1KHT9_9PLEO|nr:hypothetical protein K504DRAFT_523451 [Pleomassaria siparia CBS 279.74]